MRKGYGNGVGVDRLSGPVVDPTKNVEDAIDNLKETVDGKFKALATLSKERVKRVEFIAKLRAGHNKELRKSDNARLASQRREDQATALADKQSVLGAVQTLATTTESVRLQLEKRVADSAEALSKTTAEGNKSTETRIAALEKAAYTGAGEKSVSDPAMILLAESVAKLAATSQENAGERRFADPALVALNENVSKLLIQQTTTSGNWSGANKLWLLITGGVIFFLALSGRIDLISTVAQPNPVQQVAPRQ